MTHVYIRYDNAQTKADASRHSVVEEEGNFQYNQLRSHSAISAKSNQGILQKEIDPSH